MSALSKLHNDTETELPPKTTKEAHVPVLIGLNITSFKEVIEKLENLQTGRWSTMFSRREEEEEARLEQLL